MGGGHPLPVGGHVVVEKSSRRTVAEDRRGTLGDDHIVISRHLVCGVLLDD